MSTVAIALLAVTLSKTVALVSDPINGSLTPKAIPGARLDYTIQINNSTLTTLDQDKTVIVDALPAKTKLCLADLGLAGSGPLAFTSALSGLSYSFGGLGAADDLAFSKDGGGTWTYTPLADADGCDALVTNIRIEPKGKLNAGGAASFRVRVMVK